MLNAEATHRRHDQNNDKDNQPAENVQGVKSGHGEVARGPHVAEGNVLGEVTLGIFLHQLFDSFRHFLGAETAFRPFSGHLIPQPARPVLPLFRHGNADLFGIELGQLLVRRHLVVVLLKLIAETDHDLDLVGFLQVLEDLFVVFRAVVAVDAIIDVAGKNLVVELGLVFDRLDDQEDAAQDQGYGNEADRLTDIPLAQGRVGQHDGQAAANEHKRVQSADPFNEVDLVWLGPRLRFRRRSIPQNDVNADQRGEKHDLRHEK